MSSIHTASQLAALNTAQLRTLQSQLERELVQSERSSKRRAEILAQLDLVSKALAKSYLPGLRL